MTEKLFDFRKTAQEEVRKAVAEILPGAAGGDLISRQAALNCVYGTSPNKIKGRIAELPSAQTERKKGKWIERNPRNSPDCRLIECSECGNAYIVGYNINYDDWIDGRNFCMKCGADLRGGSNGKST